MPLAGPLDRNYVHSMNINDLLNPTPPSNTGGNAGGNYGPSLEELRLTRIRERNHYADLLEQKLNKEIKDRENKGPARFVNRNILCSDLNIKFVVKNPTLPAYDSWDSFFCKYKRDYPDAFNSNTHAKTKVSDLISHLRNNKN